MCVTHHVGALFADRVTSLYTTREGEHLELGVRLLVTEYPELWLKKMSLALSKRPVFISADLRSKWESPS